MYLEKLNNLYPFTSDFKKSILTILFISIVVFVLVLFFRSEIYTDNGPWSQRILISSYFGLVTFVFPSITTLIVQNVITPEREIKWTVKNEILLYLFHFITISMGNFLLSHLVFENDFSLLNLGQALFSTIFIGSIPVSIHVMNEQKKLLKKHLSEAELINDQQDRKDNSSPDSNLSIEIGSLKILERDLLYIESNKNYLNIFLANQEKKSIRCTMNKMEKILSNHPHIVRCHRAYFINTNKIDRVEGNAQGLKVYVSREVPFIPVSRSYINIIKTAV